MHKNNIATIIKQVIIIKTISLLNQLVAINNANAFVLTLFQVCNLFVSYFILFK